MRQSPFRLKGSLAYSVPVGPSQQPKPTWASPRNKSSIIKEESRSLQWNSRQLQNFFSLSSSFIEHSSQGAALNFLAFLFFDNGAIRRTALEDLIFSFFCSAQLFIFFLVFVLCGLLQLIQNCFSSSIYLFMYYLIIYCVLITSILGQIILLG